ncbi:hypothetical protein [Levilactobacillus yiduensis]|nr:hypothetical protein [Levilactobacillus yiduensis]
MVQKKQLLGVGTARGYFSEVLLVSHQQLFADVDRQTISHR